MTDERYVLLAVGPPRAEWIRALTQWCQSAALPVELVKCVSVDDVATRLGSRHGVSAAVVDEHMSGLGRDLFDTAGRTGCPTLVIGADRDPDWKSLGASAVLDRELTRSAILAALREHASPVRTTRLPERDPAERVPPPGRLVAVTGPGGTGASSTAMALAQGLAGLPSSLAPGPGDDGPPRPPWRVLLADLKRDAEQAMLHDSGDVVPGIQELVDACRRRSPSPAETVELTFNVPERGYHLLLGMRRPSAWVDIPPRALGVAIDALQSTYEVTVCDIDCDLEGEEDGGSTDVEERNVMARTVAERAHVVVVVGHAGVKGLHSLTRVLGSFSRFGVPSDHLLPVLVDRGRTSGARREVRRALEAGAPAGASKPPIWVYEPDVEKAVRDGLALPTTLCRPLAGAVAKLAASTGTGHGAVGAETSAARRKPPVQRLRGARWRQAEATA